jgi:hypothetical protein
VYHEGEEVFGFAELPLPKAVSGGRSRPLARRRNAFAAWLSLIGLIIPAAEVAFNMGGVKFTVGRLGIMLLLLPAALTLFQKARRFVLSDALVCATASWMLIAGAMAPGSISLSSSGAEALELAGGYFVARAFFFGPPALQTFVGVLKILAFAAIALAIVDSISGQLVAHLFVAPFFGVAPIDYQVRGGMIRATSTFDHAILFGAFCCIVGTILLHSEANVRKLILFVSISLLGSILSWSSSSLMGFSIVMAAYCYNRLMRGFAMRWLLFWLIAGAISLSFFMASNNPMGWILSHLTLDPESGYYRLMIWDAVFSKMPESPIFGFGFNLFDNWILDNTVDSVWLVLALRFGEPVVILLLMSNIASVLPTGFRPDGEFAKYMLNMCTGLTLVLVIFMFVGLTVHFWNFMWIFWGICLGVRGSLREWCLHAGSKVPVNLIEAEYWSARDLR